MSDLLSDDFRQNYLHQWFMPDILKLLRNKPIKKITYKLKSLLKFFVDNEIASIEDIELMQYLISAGKPQKDPFNPVEKDHLEAMAEIITGFSTDYQKLLLELKDNHALALYREIDLPLCYIIDKMEKAGIKIDSQYLKQLSSEFGNEITKLEQEIFNITGTKFNIAKATGRNFV